jgi:hypothetical protein
VAAEVEWKAQDAICLDLAKSDFVIELGVAKLVHLRMERLDFARRHAVPSDVVQRSDGPRVRGLHLRDALDHRRHLMAEQSEVGSAGRDRLERFQARFNTAQAGVDTSKAGLEVGLDVAEATVDRT